jgi:hypothetical protein
VLSGREATYAAGKDTGHYWEAGASNVHWVVGTDAQVGEGFAAALTRVRADGVLVEGNSFLQYAEPDFTIMVARPDQLKIKPTARRALARTSALYVSQEGDELDAALLEGFLRKLKGEKWFDELPADVPVYTRATLAEVIARIRETGAQAVPV